MGSSRLSAVMNRQQKFSVIVLLIVGLFSIGANARNWYCPRSVCSQIFTGGSASEYCTGELVITPSLPRTFRKCDQYDSKELKCRVMRNVRGNHHLTQLITVKGFCCWKVTSTTGGTEIFEPGHDNKQPSVAYFEKIETVPCPP